MVNIRLMFSVSVGDYAAISCFLFLLVLYYCDLNKDFAVIPVFPLCFVTYLIVFLCNSTLLANTGS